MSRRSNRIATGLFAALLAVWILFVGAVLMSYHRPIRFSWVDHNWQAIELEEGAFALLTGRRTVATVIDGGRGLSSGPVGWDDPLPLAIAPESAKQDAVDADFAIHLAKLSLKQWPRCK